MSAEEELAETRVTLVFSMLLSLVPCRSAFIRASMMQNIRERSFSLAKELGFVHCPLHWWSLIQYTRSLCETNHVEDIWTLPSTIHRLESLVNAVQQEDQMTTKFLESALKEDIMRIRNVAEAVVLSTVETTILSYSRPPPKWMNEQVSLPYHTSCSP
jgi:hypothetical protein